jgi:hypothetical protein
VKFGEAWAGVITAVDGMGVRVGRGVAMGGIGVLVSGICVVVSGIGVLVGGICVVVSGIDIGVNVAFAAIQAESRRIIASTITVSHKLVEKKCRSFIVCFSFG